MAIVRTDDKNYAAIAEAIRAKLGVTYKYKPEEMPKAISSISGGGTNVIADFIFVPEDNVTSQTSFYFYTLDTNHDFNFERFVQEYRYRVTIGEKSHEFLAFPDNGGFTIGDPVDSVNSDDAAYGFSINRLKVSAMMVTTSKGNDKFYNLFGVQWNDLVGKHFKLERLDSGGIELTPLDNPASADNIESPYQAYGADGNVIHGALNKTNIYSDGYNQGYSDASNGLVPGYRPLTYEWDPDEQTLTIIERN